MAHRSPYAEDVVGVELIIVEDEVVVSFGADEECPPEVVADADSGMNGKMRAVDGGPAAVSERAAAGVVKQESCAASAGHEVGSDLRSYAAGIHTIYVVQNRSI